MLESQQRALHDLSERSQRMDSLLLAFAGDDEQVARLSLVEFGQQGLRLLGELLRVDLGLRRQRHGEKYAGDRCVNP